MPLSGNYAQGADRAQTPHVAASEQDQHCFFEGISKQNTIKVTFKNKNAFS